MTGTLLPSTALTLCATRWGTQRRETRGVRAFTTGLTPLTIGLLRRDRLGAGAALRRATPRTRSARSR